MLKEMKLYFEYYGNGYDACATEISRQDDDSDYAIKKYLQNLATLSFALKRSA